MMLMLNYLDIFVMNQVVRPELVWRSERLVALVAEVSPDLVVHRHDVPLELVGRVEGLGALVADVVVHFLVDIEDVALQPVLFDEGGGALDALEPLVAQVDTPVVVVEPGGRRETTRAFQALVFSLFSVGRLISNRQKRDVHHF